MRDLQVLTCLDAPVLGAQPLTVEQVRAGKFGAGLGRAQVGDRLLVQPLGDVALAQQCAGPGRDAESPRGAGRLRERGEPLLRGGGPLGSAWIAYGAASTMWDDDRWRAILLRQVGLARRVGALDHLPILLGALTMAAVWRGDFAGAAELIMEADAATEATGSQIAPYAPMLLASLQGRQDEAVPLIEATIAVAPARGQGAAAT
jgi:hypothetical protein